MTTPTPQPDAHVFPHPEPEASGGPKRVLIVGGGFAGVETARALERRLPAGWEVVLYSRENHLVFTPLLADVVGASINPLHVVWPVREMARGASCRTARVTGIDAGSRSIVYEGARGEPERAHYDHLVLACGIPVRMDIVPGMATHGWPLKTLGDALMLRNHLIGQLERAELERDPEQKARMLSVAIVGGGFTGVEVAGAVLDLMNESTGYFDSIAPSDISITLVDGGPRILAPLTESLSAKADRRMRRRGLDIRTGVSVHGVRADGIVLGGDEVIHADTVISAVGNSIQPLIASSELPLERNRIRVTPEMRVEGHEDIWAIGDCAAVPNAFDESVSPTLAQFATRQARQLARNIASAIDGEPLRPFHYRQEGMFAAIGHHDAVGQVFKFPVSGLFAYALWRGIYWAKMPSFARKLQIAFDWAWDLFFSRDIVELTTLQTPRVGRAHYEAGQEIVHQGEQGSLLYIIERGVAGVYQDGSDEPVRRLGPGEHFGEDALLHSTVRTTTVRAEETLDVVTLNRETLASIQDNVKLVIGEIGR